MGRPLGQHFLVDSTTVNRISDMVVSVGSEAVVEIGLGEGFLTSALLERFTTEKLVSLELDTRLANKARRLYSGDERIAIVNADARSVSIDSLPHYDIMSRSGYSVVGNLPYYAATPILMNFITAEVPPTDIICMLQDEVADSICDREGKRRVLGIIVQTYGNPTKIFRVPPEMFNPPPKVNSAVIHIKLFSEPLVERSDSSHFFEFVGHCFTNPRKTLINSLSSGLQITRDATSALVKECNVPVTARAHELTIAQLHQLYQLWKRTEING